MRYKEIVKSPALGEDQELPLRGDNCFQYVAGKSWIYDRAKFNNFDSTISNRVFLIIKSIVKEKKNITNLDTLVVIK